MGHNLVNVPYLAVSPLNPKRPSRLNIFYPEEAKWLINQKEIYDARKQIQFINNHLSTDVQIKQTFKMILLKNLIVMSVLAGLALLIQRMYPVLLN